MESFNEIKVDDGHAEELGVIIHEGREFASGGFYVDLESGRMVAYVVHSPGRYPFALQTWGGQHLSSLRRTGESQGFYGTKLEHFQTGEPIAGFYWYGKGLGAGCMIRLRKGRAAKS